MKKALLLPVGAVVGGLVFVSTPAQNSTQPRLSIRQASTQSVELVWPNQGGSFVVERTASLTAPITWETLPQGPIVNGNRVSVTVSVGAGPQFYRLRQAAHVGATVVETSPAPGESGVAVTRETILRFSAPLAADTSINGQRLYAEFGGRRLLARPELSGDRRTATLFYLENLPASARVNVTFDGAGLKDATGTALDPDGDGTAGGQFRLSFNTSGVTGLPGTAVIGHVYASEKNTDGSNKPLANVIVTVDGAEETLRAVTDATGSFRLQPAPAGRFFVHVDGRTAVGSQWPGGAYYPFVGKAWEAVAGRTNNLAGGSGEIFLPLIQSDALQTVSATAETKVTFSPSVLAANPALSGVEVNVPANALFSDNGARGGRVGIAPVPPDRLPEPLPPGLNFPLVITVQTDGGSNFDVPVPVKFPNLPDPVTGVKLGPGEKTVLWSFNHDTGRWEIQGTMTISADGQFAVTDPGVGIRQPGWHGVNPGTEPEPEPNPPPDPKPPFPDPPEPEEDPCEGQVGHYDCDKDGCAETSEPCEEECEAKKKEAKRIEEYCPLTRAFTETIDSFFSCPLLGDCPDPAWRKKFLECREQLADQLADYHICASKRGGASLLPAAARRIGLQTLTSQVNEQRLLVEAAARPFDLLFGSPEFTAIEPLESERASNVILKLGQAYQPGGPGGAVITPAERAELLALPLPSNLTIPLLATAIDRLNAFNIGTLPAVERQAILDARAAYDALWQTYRTRGWRTPFDGFHMLDTAFSQAAKSTANETFFPRRKLFYRVINLESGFEIRGRLDALGRFGSLFLPARTYLRIEYLDPVTLALGKAVFRSETTGIRTPIPAALMFASATEPDQDGDGLADAAERIVGTNPAQADSDGDGILDGVEIRERLNPLDGQSVTAGPVAVLPTMGQATEIAVGNNLAVVADSMSGVAIINVADPLQPVLLNRVNLRGSAVYAAVDGDRAAIAQGPAGVALLDLSNPSSPVILWDEAIQADGRAVSLSAVALRGRLLLAGTETSSQLVVMDTLTRRVRQVLPTGYNFANPRTDDMHLAGDRLYLLSKQENDSLNPGIMAVFALDGDVVLPVQNVAVTGGAAEPGSQVRRKFFVGGSHAYAGYFGGHIVVDIAAPTNAVVARPARNLLSVYDLADNGAGLLLQAATSGNLTEFVLASYNIQNPTNLTNFLASVPLLGKPRALTLHRGRALVVGADTGLTTINYLGPDLTGQPPTLAPRLSLLPRSARDGGALWRLDARAHDDRQVRDVSVTLDGRRVGFDGSYPFEIYFEAPVAGGLNRALTVTATDLSGNSTSAVVPLVDTTPPHLVELNPPAVGSLSEGTLSQLRLEFDEPLAAGTVPADGLKIVQTGPDRNFGTTDDVPVVIASLDLQPDQRTLVARFATPLTAANYRATLAAGLADLTGNARPAPLSWDFTVSSATLSVLDFLTPTEVVAVGGMAPPIVVRFRSVVPPETLGGFGFEFRDVGADGIAGNANDVVLGNGTGRLIAPDTIEVTPPAPLPPGRYALLMRSPLMPGTSANPVTRRLDFRNTINQWTADGGGVWSRAQNWSNGAIWANDALSIPGPASRVTTNDMSASLAALRSDAALVIQRNLTVAGEAEVNAPVTISEGNITLAGGGMFHARQGMTIFSSIFANTSFGLGAIHLHNHGLARWQSGDVRILTPEANWHNEPGATFEIGPGAVEIRRDTPISQPGGRFYNFGLVRKAADTNLVTVRGLRMRNDGQIVIERGGLSLAEYEGAGRIEITAGAGVFFFGTARFNSGSRLHGAGTVELGASTSTSIFPVDARIDGSFEVTGVTRLRQGNATFVTPVNLPGAAFETFANVNETLRFNAPVRLGRLFGRGGNLQFDVPAEVDTLTLFGSKLAGPGRVRVNTEISFDNASALLPGGDVEVMQAARQTNATIELSGRTLHILPGAEFLTQGGGFNFSSTRGRLLISGAMRKTGNGGFANNVTLENRGLIEVAEGTFALRFGTVAAPLGDFIQSPGAETRLTGGGVTVDVTPFTHRNGILGGVGSFRKSTTGTGTFTNLAVLRVGLPHGTLSVDRFNLVCAAGSELRIGLGPEGAGKLELLASGARATLGGTLRIERAEGFSPDIGQTFTVMSFSSRTGQFENVILPDLGAGRKLEVAYSSTTVTLNVASAP